MLLDVFKNDAFHFLELQTAIQLAPFKPTGIGKMGIFQPRPVSTTVIAIELRDGKLTLVPNAPRGALGPAKNLERRKLKNFNTLNLPQRVAVMAEEVQGLRAFGKQTEVETAMNLLGQKMRVARTDLDVTHEFHRAGALRGKILDADGTTVIYDLYSEFGVSQLTHDFALDNDATDVRSKVVSCLRKIEDALGDTAMDGVEFLCSSTFMDALVDHPEVKENLKFDKGYQNRSDLRKGFEYGGATFREYRGTIGGNAVVPTGQAIPVPMGVPDLFESYYSPAPYMETVNTMGQEVYMKPRDMDFDVGVEWQVLSCPLHICTRPNAIVKCGLNAAAIA